METQSFDNIKYSVKCGKAIIFHHFSEDRYPEDPDTLPGNKKDAEDLERTLKKFNFEVTIEKDKTKNEIKKSV